MRWTALANSLGLLGLLLSILPGQSRQTEPSERSEAVTTFGPDHPPDLGSLVSQNLSDLAATLKAAFPSHSFTELHSSRMIIYEPPPSPGSCPCSEWLPNLLKSLPSLTPAPFRPLLQMGVCFHSLDTRLAHRMYLLAGAMGEGRFALPWVNAAVLELYGGDGDKSERYLDLYFEGVGGWGYGGVCQICTQFSIRPMKESTSSKLRKEEAWEEGQQLALALELNILDNRPRPFGSAQG